MDFERDSYGLIKRVKITKETLHELEEIANAKEVEHYREVLKNLKELGFSTFVTLNHQTQPIWLHDPIHVRENFEKARAKGWVDERAILEFAKFAAFVAWKLGGDLVDFWATFDEPMVTVELGYLAPYVGWPPGILNPKAAKAVIINQLVGHARAYEAVKTFSDKPVGIILNIIPAYPRDPQRPPRT